MSGALSAPSYDPLPALRAVLAADATLAAAVTGGDVASAYAAVVRIYTGGLPSPLIVHTLDPTILPPTIVIKGSGLGGDPNIAVKQFGRIELRCYHATEATARALWYQALNVLRETTPALVGQVWVEADLQHSGPNADNEPGGGYLIATGFVPFSAIGHAP